MVSHGPSGRTTQLGLTPFLAGGAGRTGGDWIFIFFTNATSAAGSSDEDKPRKLQ